MRAARGLRADVRHRLQRHGPGLRLLRLRQVRGQDLGTIFGLLDLGFGLGSAVGPWWAGWMFDRYGNYDAVILGVALGVMITGLGLWAATRRRGLA